jgi:hypothetical protein
LTHILPEFQCSFTVGIEPEYFQYGINTLDRLYFLAGSVWLYSVKDFYKS